MLVVTLSLSTYAASLAATLDNHLYDQQRYQVGAEVSLIDVGDDPGAVRDAAAGATTRTAWNFTPVAEYTRLPGIVDATRVPPFVVEIAWPALLRVYALFGLLYLAALAVLVRALLKMRLFDAIKLGETV